MERLSLELWSHSVILKHKDWLGTAWPAAQVFTGCPHMGHPVAMWHKSSDAASSWTVRLPHPAFSPGSGDNAPQLQKLPASLSLGPGGHSLFSASGPVFAPWIVLKDIYSTHRKPTSTQQALNGCGRSLSFPDTEMPLMRAAVLRGRMAPDTVTASPGGACAAVPAERGAFAPGESADAASLLNHTRTQWTPCAIGPPA